MKKIGLFDTSIMSFNLGDQIIMESFMNEMNFVLEDSFVVRFPTHSPLFHKYEFSLRKEDSFRNAINNLDLKFIAGTNLIEKNMKKRKNAWNIHISDLNYIDNFILVGVGTDGLNKCANNYTKKFYNKALSKSFIHSVRDSKTEKFLQTIGINALNTSCVTMWSLTPEHCKQIPSYKANEVVFTLTDYSRSKEDDKKFISLLFDNYSKVNYWIQGYDDLDYIREITSSQQFNKINFISPSLNAYTNYLNSNNCDYVGTRLHAGIKAMQKYKRSIILGVDNRASDIYVDTNINYVNRKDIIKLNSMINSNLQTKLNIPLDNIERFKKQFKK